MDLLTMGMQTRRQFIARSAGLVAGAPLLGACATRSATPARPNLIYIMADDLGYADVGAFGGTTGSTPRLDALAREGVLLTQAYSAAPVCSPTRVALMTGRYPARTEAGLHEPLTTHPIGLSPALPTLARLLERAGYENALIGKWHLGLLPEFHPLRHGFHEFYGHLGAAIDYATGMGTEHLEHDFFDGTEPVRIDNAYATDLLSDRAVAFITRPRSQPFFLSLQYNAPHWPWQAPGDPAYPDSLRWQHGGSPETFAQMVRSMDDGIGRVLNALRTSGLDASTLVLFTSDNGGERFSNMGPYRGGKMTLWEGGIRVAGLARWPEVIPAGTRCDQVAITMDWTATLLAAAGAQPDPAYPLDGIDLLPQLRGEAATFPRDLFWRLTQRRRFNAVRSGDWKRVVDEDDTEHLYNLAADPGEAADLAATEPATLARLRDAYAQWEAQILPPAPLEERYR